MGKEVIKIRGLPKIVYKDQYKSSTLSSFGGYDHNPGAADGSIYYGENLSSRLYPLLCPRPHRYTVGAYSTPQGIYGGGGLTVAADGKLYGDGEERVALSPGEKIFCSLGKRIIIFPDKICISRDTWEWEYLEEDWSGTASVGDGTYAGEPALMNTVSSNTEFPFRAGDAVNISGCPADENNGTFIIREVSSDKKKLFFYENTFSGESFTAVLTVKREVPDMDFLCENENRLWGCKGSSIYASKLGDPFNWNVFDGLSTDSFAVDVGSAADFTGCVSYLGYPVFFKEENIYKVYGDKPSNFQVMGSAALGVEKGSWKSLAVAGETLFYLSRAGVASYGGGQPQIISAPLGPGRLKNGVSGSDGRRYYISAQEENGESSLFVFDTVRGLWQREDGLSVISFAWDGELYMLCGDGRLLIGGEPRSVPPGSAEDEFGSAAEFSDFTHGDPDKKGVLRLSMRIELPKGAFLRVLVRYDSENEWKEAARFASSGKKSFLVPLLLRRCDHYSIRLEGRGEWRLHSLTREWYKGSGLKAELR